MKGAAILSIFAMALSAFAMPAEFARRGGGHGVDSWSGGFGGSKSDGGFNGEGAGGGSECCPDSISQTQLRYSP
jgi:hypothetical protein